MMGHEIIYPPQAPRPDQRPFQVGDRVGAKPAVREQMHKHGDPNWPAYGHVVNVGGQSLVWVRDHLGGEWGLPAHELEHID